MVHEWYGGHDAAYDRGTIGPGGAVSQFFRFSSTCYYFGESLTEQLGPDAPPIGLIHTVRPLQNNNNNNNNNNTLQPLPH